MDIESLRKMTSGPRDSAMLRLTLAQLLLDQKEFSEAENHLLAALEMNRDYTAAWKALGKVRQQSGDADGAADAWTRGIEIAREKGDKQAEKEMTVFARRLEKSDAG
jgi:Tfp pilus assembly protein PilF